MVLFTETEANYFAIAVVNISMAPVVGILNALFIRAIYKHKCLQTNQNKLLILLSVIDIFNSILTQLSFAIECFLLSYDFFDFVFDFAVSISGYAFTGMSFVAVILISSERYFAITFPYLYSKHYRLKNALLVYMLLTFVFSSLIVTFLYLDLTVLFHSFAAVNIAIGCFIVCFCYYSIYKVSQRTVRRVSKVSMSTINDAKTQIKSTRTAIIAVSILLFLIISYLPFLMVSIWISNDSFESRSSAICSMLLPWAQTLALTNGIFSPLIYYWRIQEVRKKMISWNSKENSE